MTGKKLPRGVWVLGLVSMLMDISSEMIHSLLPLFMATSLGMSYLAVGLVEGLAEATALMVKVFSGVLSDYLGRRKALAVLGYALGALSKPVFALAACPSVVLGARLADRVGKGIRGAPRDALVADLTPPELRGAAFGLRQSLDTLGAFWGPLLAVGLMILLAGDFRSIFWLAAIPGLMAVGLLVLGLKEPEQKQPASGRAFLSWKNLQRLDVSYWRVVFIGAALSMARFSEAFLVLRAERSGLELALIPLIMVCMNFVYAICAYPFGWLSDRVSRKLMLTLGVLPLLAADLILAIDGGTLLLLVGVGLWGVHLGLTQGLLASLVAATAPEDLRGTAFGFFNMAGGIAVLTASLTAGWLWDSLGYAWTFYAGALFCCSALLLLTASARR
ncbi:MAG: MFS transporter [Desulfovibrionaceae bacterium]|nr:MFS transporter [Desulfovibrionaceae bacterium]